METAKFILIHQVYIKMQCPKGSGLVEYDGFHSLASGTSFYM